jgi:sugar lactone lactonase YvrE
MLDGGRASAVLDGLLIQNGAAFSPDGRTFYLSDSHADRCVIWAFDFDAADGSLSNRRVFHKPRRGRPDGAAVDVEGCYWFAAIDAGCLVRVDPRGRESGAIDLPVSRPTNLTFAGPDLTTLYVTTMRAGLDDAALAAQPLAGALLTLDADVAGLPQHRYRATGNSRSRGAVAFQSTSTQGG